MSPLRRSNNPTSSSSISSFKSASSSWIYLRSVLFVVTSRSPSGRWVILCFCSQFRFCSFFNSKRFFYCLISFFWGSQSCFQSQLIGADQLLLSLNFVFWASLFYFSSKYLMWFCEIENLKQEISSISSGLVLSTLSLIHFQSLRLQKKKKTLLRVAFLGGLRKILLNDVLNGIYKPLLLHLYLSWTVKFCADMYLVSMAHFHLQNGEWYLLDLIKFLTSKSECIRERVRASTYCRKMVEFRLRWFGLVWRRLIEAQSPWMRVDY